MLPAVGGGLVGESRDELRPWSNLTALAEDALFSWLVLPVVPSAKYSLAGTEVCGETSESGLLAVNEDGAEAGAWVTSAGVAGMAG